MVKFLISGLMLLPLLGAGAAGKPALQLVSRAPLVIKGENFHAGERVRVTALTGTGPRMQRVATSGGRFRVKFDLPARGCGAAYAVSARGTTGTTAHLAISGAPVCVPPPRD